MSIIVRNCITDLVHLDDHSFTKYLNDLTEELSANQPYKWMIRGSINNASKPFASDPHRDKQFQKLLDLDLEKIAYEAFDQVTRLLPPPVDEILCHIVPAIESKGGGACYAPGKILLALRIDDLSPFRLRRNIAHEYSHTIRYIQKPIESDFGFGEAIPYSVRDFLIFEGLASVLPETLYPHIELPVPEVSSESEAAFWEKTKLDATGMDAYIEYMSMKAYEIGSRIVRKYLETHKISIVEAHYLSDEELFWNSGYPFIR